MGEKWLVLGHGSVGASLVNRLVRTDGNFAFVYDPKPRLPVPQVPGLQQVGRGPVPEVDFVAVCVPPAASGVAAAFVRESVPGAPTVFDWTSALPGTKKRAAEVVAGAWVDIALLDSLDKQDESALLAVSGPRAAEESGVLRRLGFEVVVVGREVGDAAQTKLVRSLFMKSLEALVVEARAIGSELDPSGTAWESVERNLGPIFSGFADLLVVTDATHASRRSVEIAEAVEFARSEGYDPIVAAAAGRALAQLGALWEIERDVADEGLRAVLDRAIGVFGRVPTPTAEMDDELRQ